MSASNAGDLGSIPGLGRSRGEGNGNLLQYSCLENPMDGEAWYGTVRDITYSLYIHYIVYIYMHYIYAHSYILAF